MRIVLDSTELVEIYIACDDLMKKLTQYCQENHLQLPQVSR